MQLDLNANPALKDMLLQRLAVEFGETAKANFLLDMVADSLLAENKELQARNADLVSANSRLKAELDAVREENAALKKPVRKARE